MLSRLIATTREAAPSVARLVLALVFFPHGAQKLLGWFGGPGFVGTMGYFTDTMHFPYMLGVLAVVAEFFGALGLLVGLLGRIAAFGISCVMVVAVLTTHIHVGFFMNWFGTQQGEGFEYHLLVLALTTIVMWRGSGAWSLDLALTERVSPATTRAATTRLAA
jgi:putative oxidoreductase